MHVRRRARRSRPTTAAARRAGRRGQRGRRHGDDLPRVQGRPRHRVARGRAGAGRYTVGVLVQANHGRRDRLAVNGAPVGAAIPAEEVPVPRARTRAGAGSIIVARGHGRAAAAHQCTRLAQRASFGIARTGGMGEHWSGDLLLAFSTANRGLPAGALGEPAPLTLQVEMLADVHMDVALRGRDRGHGGGDPQRAARRGDDDRPRRPDRARARPRAAARGAGPPWGPQALSGARTRPGSSASSSSARTSTSRSRSAARSSCA